MKYFLRNIWYLLAAVALGAGFLLIRYLSVFKYGLLLSHIATFILVLGAILIIKSRLHDTLRQQLISIGEIFQSISPQEVPVITKENYAPELRKLVETFLSILKYNENWNYEFQKRYNNLLNSHLNQEEKYAQTYTIRYIFEVISRELDLEQLLKQTTDIVMGVLGSKGCFIYILDENGTSLAVKASSGVITIDGGKEIIPITSSSIIAQAWENRRVYSEIAGELIEKMEESEPKATRLVIPLSGRLDFGICLGIMVIEQEVIGGLRPDLVEFAGLIAQEISLCLENAHLYGKMKHMAIHDALTGVYNRMHFINYMEELFAKKPKMVSLIMFDMDYFKRVNDQYGHLAGDMVLKTSTALIQKMLPSGIFARYGGEEFVIVLPDVDIKGAYLFAETCRQKIQGYDFITTEGVRIPVTLSAGLSNYPLNANSYESLLQHADDALYVAKNTGRNKVCIDERKNLSYSPLIRTDYYDKDLELEKRR
jgi:diguanylate cyclase (GGDEF)-like protein